jgi:hypothetical protein
MDDDLLTWNLRRLGAVDVAEADATESVSTRQCAAVSTHCGAMMEPPQKPTWSSIES